MGQPITVTRKPTTRANTIRFEANRSLTGMGHERYTSIDDVRRDRPVDRLARTVLAHAGVRAVHVYGNEITVEIDPAARIDDVAGEIETLFIHYREGVQPSFP